MKNNADIAGIGISTAGIVDSGSGTIVYANDNFPGYAGLKIKETLEKKFGLPALVNNDVNSAALAEMWAGAARGRKTFFCMTVGTGIGGAIVIDGKLFRGSNFMAAEVGYFNKKGRDEYYENRASVSALIAKVRTELGADENIDGKSIFKNINEGDAVYNQIFERWIEELCVGIANVICMFDPGLIIIGGGVSRQKIFIDAVRKRLADRLPPVFIDGTEICAAGCGNDAGMIGSVYEFVNIGSK
jgi:glucokinase